METFWADLRRVVRNLAQAPQFTVSIILVLGVGIGVASSMFSMVNAYRFRPLPVEDGYNLVVLASQRPAQQSLVNLSYPNFKDLRDRATVFTALLGYMPIEARVRNDEFSERISAQAVTGNYFHALGVLPSLGRVLDESDDTVEATPAAVISHSVWQSALASDPRVIGKTVYINGLAFTVAGVVADGFRGTDSLFHSDLWVPFTKGAGFGDGGAEDRRADNLRVIGRLQPNIGLSEAQANMDVLTATLRQQYPDDNRGLKTRVLWEKRARPDVGLAGQFSLSMAVVMALQIVGLASTISNCTSLMLARASARQKELALRLALGAGRWRVFREVWIESLFLGAAASVVGLISAYAALQLLAYFQIPGLSSFYLDWSPDWTVFVFAMLLAFAVSIAIAAGPAMAATRTDVQRSLQGLSGSSAGGPVSRGRYRVVVSQFASVTMALMIAGALRYSNPGTATTDLGFEPENRVVVRLSPSDGGYDIPQSRRFVDAFLEQIRSQPGVIAADVAENVRLSFQNTSMEIAPDGGPDTSKVSVNYNVIGRAYFETMGIALAQGRSFDQRDTEAAPSVAIVNEHLAAKFWPSQNPIGKRFTAQRQNETTVFEVVGLEKTGQYVSLNEAPRDFFYLPYAQQYRPNLAVIIHTRADARSMATLVRGLLLRMAPHLAVWDVTTQKETIEASQFPRRFAGTVMGALGFIQFLVAGIGMYGLLSFLTRLQTREIGIRVSLGATHGRIQQLYIGRGAKLAAKGLLRGGVVSIASLLLMRAFLPGFRAVASFDLRVAVCLTVMITAVTLLAGYLPTRRVLADNPMAALKAEQ